MRYSYLLLIPVIVLGGCNAPSEPENETPLDLSTPGKTLTTLASVWTDYRDIDSYKRLLTQLNPPAYCFFFDPCIIPEIPPQTGPVIPQTWTYQEDISATGNMFASSYDIKLELTNASDFDDPNIPGNFYRADNVLLVLRIYPENGDFYYEASGPCDFEFTKVGDEWLISAWYDRTGGENNLGELRLMYE